MDIKFREAQPQDEDEVFALAASLATSYQLDKQDFSEIYINLINESNADLVVAVKEQQIIGYVLVFHHSTFYANGIVSWVEEIYVTEKYRRKQIGKKLIQLVEMKASERGSKLVALATRRASDFYMAIGYQESATYYKKPL